MNWECSDHDLIKVLSRHLPTKMWKSANRNISQGIWCPNRNSKQIPPHIQVCVIMAIPNYLVQNGVWSDISGPYGNMKCRFPLCPSNYGRQKITMVITAYENFQLLAAKVRDFKVIGTDCQQSNGNYTTDLSGQATYSKFNYFNVWQWQALKTRRHITNADDITKYVQ